MSPRLGIAVLAAVLAAGCAGVTERPAGTAPVAAVALERQILLTVRQPRDSAVGLAGDASRRYLRRRAYGPTPAVERTLTQLAREHGLTRVDGWPIASLDVYCEVLEVPPGASVDDVLARLASDPRVDLAQRMNAFRTLARRYDDPYADLQSSVTLLELERAHEIATGKGVTVAVVDSAVDTRHPELDGRVRFARDLVAERPVLRRAEIHGTAVAGVIASSANNAEGIVGVAPDVTIAALRACWAASDDDALAECSSFTLARALEAVLAIEPAVLNLSLTGPADPLLSRMLEEVIRRGTVVVVAQPDGDDPRSGFPASQPRVLVAAAEHSAPPPDAHYVLAAPAHEILTTLPNGQYAFLSGTSLAAAHVSGVAALLLQSDPTLTVERIAELLARSAPAPAPELRSISASRALEELTGARAAAAARAEPLSFRAESRTSR